MNQRITTANKTVISALSAAAFYGKGIFTTIAIQAGKSFLWEKHWRRLRDNAEILKIDLSEFSESSTKDALEQINTKNNITQGRARITFFDEKATEMWPIENDGKTTLLITTDFFRPKPDNFHLTISPYKINSSSPLAGVKSCNYLENLMAKEDSLLRGFNEAVRLNERGEIASACMANIFWLTDGKLFTPGLKTGCLAGITREFILERLECEEVEYDREVLTKASSIFLTSAGLSVVEVDDFDGRKLEKSCHPIMHLLHAGG